jgi:competence protein ComEC
MPQEPLAREVARSPLAHVALAFTAGVVAAKALALPFFACAATGAAFLVAFALAKRPSLGLMYLLTASACTGAALFARSSLVREDDIAWLATAQATPVIVTGILEDEPRRMPAPSVPDPLLSQAEQGSATVVLNVTTLAGRHGPEPLSGRARLVVAAPAGVSVEKLLAGMHAGDEVEVAGRLESPRQPGNPGEKARKSLPLLRARPGSVRLLRSQWCWSIAGWVGMTRHQAHAALDRILPPETSTLARALVLSEGAPMQRADWGKYVRTGVIHVLAISGQHLVVVGMFLWAALRLAGARQAHAALAVALALLAYALITGGKPPALRAAAVACAAGAAIVLGRMALTVNLFAFSWLTVGALNPRDLFDMGCQLSFWATACLLWLALQMVQHQASPLEKALEQKRPWPLKTLASLGAQAWQSYRVCAVMWLAVTPLVSWHAGMAAPAALLIGPPAAVLASMALVAGLAALALSWWPLAASLAGWCAHWPLAGCEALVHVADSLAWHFCHPPVPGWWVAAAMAVAVLFALFPGRAAWPALSAAGLLGALFTSWALPASTPALRVTFADVGHGGCTLIELPDGSVVLYDAGSLRGGSTASSILAPLLHSRGVRRLDAVILSHADLDHFNGVSGLLGHFSIGKVYCSESFTEKKNAALAHTLATLSRHGAALERVAAGDRLEAGPASLDILHPPAGWKGSSENASSVVVEVRHEGQSVLLTGDLEAEGLQRVHSLPRRQVSVLQAPHHGSFRVDLPSLAGWCSPALVVSCQGAPQTPRRWRLACPVWTTWEEGAVTLTWARGIEAEGHRGRRQSIPAVDE